MKLALFIVATAALLAADTSVPNPVLTPGAIDPSVTQSNIRSTICIPGYSKLHRPPDDAKWRAEMVTICKAYGTRYLPKVQEMDHLISIEIGGSVDSPKNLWPQPYGGAWGAKKKDALENRLHTLVCSDALPLAAAQKAIATDWRAAYVKYGGEVYHGRSRKAHSGP